MTPLHTHHRGSESGPESTRQSRVSREDGSPAQRSRLSGKISPFRWPSERDGENTQRVLRKRGDVEADKPSSAQPAVSSQALPPARASSQACAASVHPKVRVLPNHKTGGTRTRFLVTPSCQAGDRVRAQPAGRRDNASPRGLAGSRSAAPMFSMATARPSAALRGQEPPFSLLGRSRALGEETSTRPAG